MKRIAIKYVEAFGREHGLDQVIIFGFSRVDGRTHVCSWGKSLADCDMASRGAQFAKEKFGWPEALANAEPARMRALRMGVDRTRKAARALCEFSRTHAIYKPAALGREQAGLINDLEEALR